MHTIYSMHTTSVLILVVLNLGLKEQRIKTYRIQTQNQTSSTKLSIRTIYRGGKGEIGSRDNQLMPIAASADIC